MGETINYSNRSNAPHDLVSYLKNENISWEDTYRQLPTPNGLISDMTEYLITKEASLPDILWSGRDMARKLDPKGRWIKPAPWEQPINTKVPEMATSRAQLVHFMQEHVNPVGFSQLYKLQTLCAKHPEIARASAPMLNDYLETQTANYEYFVDNYALLKFYAEIEQSIWVFAATFPQFFPAWTALGSVCGARAGFVSTNLGNVMNNDLRFGCGNGALVLETILSNFGHDQNGKLIHESRTWKELVKLQYQSIMQHARHRSLVGGNIKAITAASILDPSVAAQLGIPLTLGIKGEDIWNRIKQMLGKKIISQEEFDKTFAAMQEQYYHSLEYGHRVGLTPTELYKAGTEQSAGLTKFIEPSNLDYNLTPTATNQVAYAAGALLSALNPSNSPALMYGANMPSRIIASSKATAMQIRSSREAEGSLNGLRTNRLNLLQTIEKEARDYGGSIEWDTKSSRYIYTPSELARERSDALRNTSHVGISWGINVLTGVSGAGKSTMLADLARQSHKAGVPCRSLPDPRLDYMPVEAFFIDNLSYKPRLLSNSTADDDYLGFFDYLEQTASGVDFLQNLTSAPDQYEPNYELYKQRWRQGILNPAEVPEYRQMRKWFERYIHYFTGVQLRTDSDGLSVNSFGEKNRLALFTVLQNLQKQGILMLDESLIGLDQKNLQAMMELLISYTSSNYRDRQTTILVTHDAGVLMELLDYTAERKQAFRTEHIHLAPNGVTISNLKATNYDSIIELGASAEKIAPRIIFETTSLIQQSILRLNTNPANQKLLVSIDDSLKKLFHRLKKIPSQNMTTHLEPFFNSMLELIQNTTLSDYDNVALLIFLDSFRYSCVQNTIVTPDFSSRIENTIRFLLLMVQPEVIDPDEETNNDNTTFDPGLYSRELPNQKPLYVNTKTPNPKILLDKMGTSFTSLIESQLLQLKAGNTNALDMLVKIIYNYTDRCLKLSNMNAINQDVIVKQIEKSFIVAAKLIQKIVNRTDQAKQLLVALDSRLQVLKLNGLHTDNILTDTITTFILTLPITEDKTESE